MEVYGYPSHSLPSSSSASPSFSFGNLVEKVRDFFGFAVSAIIGNIFSAIFTFFFALVGTLLGAMTGALIGQETESGFVRGAAVGAISGAVFSIEVFESSLLLWQSDESGIGCLLYLIFTGNHLEQVLHMNRNDYYGGESTSLHLTQLWKHFKGSEQPPKSLGSSGDYNVDSIPKPSQNPEHQRQMMVPELQMQVAQGNSQGVPPFVGLSSAFSNQTSPPTQTYPLHPRQAHVLSNSHHPYLQGPNHAASTQHQAYAMRIAKERQMQQRLQLQQQHQQQFAASNALMPHVQSQSQLPISSSMQNSSQVQPQTTSAPVSVPSTHSSSMTPMSQHQQKLHMPPHGQNRNPQTAGSGLTNQMGKQRQRQPQQQQQQSFQQSGRHHPQQRQQSQSQQQAKLIKGIGRGNVLMHQNLTIDPSLLNGISTTPAGQSAEKEEQVVHLMQGQGLYPGSGLNPVQPSKSLMPPHQQKMYSGQAIPSSKQVQQMPYSDNSNQGHAAPATSGQTLPVSHSVVTSSNHQQLQPHQKSVNQTQPIVQRVFQQNRQSNSDPPSKLQAGQAQPDQQPVSNSPQMGTATAMPQFTTDTTTVKPVVSSSGTQWKAPDQMHDSGMPNSAMQLAPNGSPPLTNSAGSEPMPMVSQGLGQGQSSGSLPPLGHNGGARWPEHQSQLQPPSTPLPPPPQQQQQQQQSPRQQMPQQLQSQQQTQHLQAGNGSLYIRPTNSRIE